MVCQSRLPIWGWLAGLPVAYSIDVMPVSAKDLRGILDALQLHYQQRFAFLVVLEAREADLVECLLVLNGEVNTVRELLRVEPISRRYSCAGTDIAILPISRSDWDLALEPEVWEAHWTGTVVN